MRRVLAEPEAARFKYLWDDAMRCRAVINPQNERTSWSFDALGQTIVHKLPNGWRASYSFDNANRLPRLANLTSDGTTMSSFLDTWGAADNRIGRVEANGDRVSWSYDPTYQLTRERRSGANRCGTTCSYVMKGTMSFTPCDCYRGHFGRFTRCDLLHLRRQSRLLP